MLGNLTKKNRYNEITSLFITIFITVRITLGLDKNFMILSKKNFMELENN